MILKRMMECQVILNYLYPMDSLYHYLLSSKHKFIRIFFIILFFSIAESDDLDMNRLATAPRPGTTLRPEATAKNPQQQQQRINSRPRTLSGRPLTGMVKKKSFPIQFPHRF